MCDLFAVTVFDCSQHLIENRAGFFLGKMTLLFEVIKKFASLAETELVMSYSVTKYRKF